MVKVPVATISVSRIVKYFNLRATPSSPIKMSKSQQQQRRKTQQKTTGGVGTSEFPHSEEEDEMVKTASQAELRQQARAAAAKLAAGNADQGGAGEGNQQQQTSGASSTAAAGAQAPPTSATSASNTELLLGKTSEELREFFERLSPNSRGQRGPEIQELIREAEGRNTRRPVVPQPGGLSNQQKRTRENDQVSPSRQPAKKAAGQGTEEQEREDVSGMDEGEEVVEEMVGLLREICGKIPGGGVDEFRRCTGMLDKLMDRFNRRAKKEAAEVYQKLREYDHSTRSVMAYNVEHWNLSEEFFGNAPIEERIAEEIQLITRNRVAVQEVIAFRPREEGRPMAAKIVLGSPRQKGVLYRMIAQHMINKTARGGNMRRVAFRDCFPREHMLSAKALVQRGMMLKKNGKITAFRVSSQGPQGVPVLQTRQERGGRWAVHLSNQGQQQSGAGADRGTGRQAARRTDQQRDRRDVYRPETVLDKEEMEQLAMTNPQGVEILYDDGIKQMEKELARIRQQRQDFYKRQAEKDLEDEQNYMEDF